MMLVVGEVVSRVVVVVVVVSESGGPGTTRVGLGAFYGVSLMFGVDGRGGGGVDLPQP